MRITPNIKLSPFKFFEGRSFERDNEFLRKEVTSSDIGVFKGWFISVKSHSTEISGEASMVRSLILMNASSRLKYRATV